MREFARGRLAQPTDDTLPTTSSSAGREGRGMPRCIARAALLAVLIVTPLMGGCAVYMAAHQPDAKDLSVLSIGQPRARLIAEFGPPVNTQVANGVRTDIFTFTQGYSSAEKAGRAVFHGAADVFTAGLWEAVGTPTEGYFN